jgi:hypothetical protein
MGRGQKYHGSGGQNTMDKGVKVPWVGGLTSNLAHGEVYSTQHYGIVCQWLAPC